MIDALSIALSGADEPEARGGAGFESGAFFLAIEPTIFGSFERWTEALERLSTRVRSVPVAPGFTEVLLPGEPEARARAARAHSLSIAPATWATIVAAGQAVGVPPPAL
jgi:LDH2 family malate/lactate/ureidoglycolate dehydrogenase